MEVRRTSVSGSNMSHRQISAIFANKNALKSCLTNVPRYSTAAQRTRMAEKNITFDPSSTATKAKEAAVFAREQYTGDIKLHSPSHSPSTIKPTPSEIHHESKGVSGIEMQHQEKETEDAYWEKMKIQKKQKRDSARKESKLTQN